MHHDENYEYTVFYYRVTTANRKPEEKQPQDEPLN